jgi:ferric-dicitrate binding protein FerR (iron transport regulator)
MNSATPECELLLRYLDDRVTPEERRGIEQWLRTDPEARAFLREVAEQSVMVADLERSASALSGNRRPSSTRPVTCRSRWLNGPVRRWAPGLAAAAAVVLLAVAAFELRPSDRSWTVQVVKVTGASQLLGSRGEHPQPVALNARLRPGDSLETRSCDAWIELALRGGTTLTMAGHSTVRLLEDAEGRSCFKLLTGNLWVSPASEPALEATVVHTLAADIDALGAQFDLQSTAAESFVRVNSGSVRVTRNVDGAAVDVPADHQLQVSMNRTEPLVVTSQPLPVADWSCDLARVPQVILGRWLSPGPFEGPRLGAAPLLWPLPNREPVMLYAVALSVAGSSDRPVLLEADSRLIFRGRTDRSQTVRFGFSTQKMRGVFAGKFEMDVRPDSLGPVGETWEVSLPLSEFRPLPPQLSFSPEGLELTDVYALTIQEDAGLEIHHIELVPLRGP